MIDKKDFFDLLRKNISYECTHQAVNQLEGDVEWSEDDVMTLCDIAVDCSQVYGTLNYKPRSEVRDFYRKILKNYTGRQSENIKKVAEIVFIIDNQLIFKFLIDEKQKVANDSYYLNKTWHDEEYDMDISVCDGLYHANSVSTAVSYIRNSKMYSREYGDAFFSNCQTSQWSDESDVRDGVYNDLFFDNCDIRTITGNHSAYGPVTFVFDESILTRHTFNIRITKGNPVNISNFGALDVRERFFTSIEELHEKSKDATHPFRIDFGHHTTIWNMPYMELFTGGLKYILIERNLDEEKSIQVKELILKELREHSQKIPVIIRPNIGRIGAVHTSASLDELWRLP